MFTKILLANRGEIACRVIDSCKRLAISTVAVYSDFDANSRHVALADEAVYIGPSSATESYLNIDAIIIAAKASGAQAIHPGYGFLSENADFADACQAADLVFIGPSPHAIRTMGSKQAAKALLADAAVPLVPGYHGTDQSAQTLLEQAQKIEAPLLIKASAGGGGKGMRRVDDLAEFATHLAAAQREAKAAFGNDEVLLEKMIPQARHVEVQIFADNQGNCLHLFERDCSLQRRHQKVIEEAPAPGLSSGTREALGQAAVAAAQAVNYRGAGTVEFIMAADESFYFMEMNTRLQVEHPVTEMITGVDLVEWQLRVAAGEALPCSQADLQMTGCAVEVRLYAENPRKRFLPATGTLHHLRFPTPTAQLRIETGVREGDSIGIYYDPMIAKVVAWADTRERAIDGLANALQQIDISGLTTNLSFLQALLHHREFREARMHTQTIDQQLEGLLASLPKATPQDVALAALAHITRLSKDNAAGSLSPWVTLGSWRNMTPSRQRFGLAHAGERYAIEVESRRDEHLVRINGGQAERFRLFGGAKDAPANVISWQKAEVMHRMRYYGDDVRLELFTPTGTLSFVLEPDYQLDTV